MRCLSCNSSLTDEEANRKYFNYEEIKNPEERYIGLCNCCIRDSDLSYYVDSSEIVTDLPEIEDDGGIFETRTMPEVWE